MSDFFSDIYNAQEQPSSRKYRSVLFVYENGSTVRREATSEEVEKYSPLFTEPHYDHQTLNIGDVLAEWIDIEVKDA